MLIISWNSYRALKRMNNNRQLLIIKTEVELFLHLWLLPQPHFNMKNVVVIIITTTIKLLCYFPKKVLASFLGHFKLGHGICHKDCLGRIIEESLPTILIKAPKLPSSNFWSHFCKLRAKLNYMLFFLSVLW